MANVQEPEKDFQRPSAPPKLPPERTFILRRFSPVNQANGRLTVEEITIYAHEVSPVGESAITFTRYILRGDEVYVTMPRLFSSYIDCEEIVMDVPRIVAH